LLALPLNWGLSPFSAAAAERAPIRAKVGRMTRAVSGPRYSQTRGRAAMSPARMRRRHRESRHVCAGCRVQRARFQYRGHVRADRDHTLCFRCFRAEVERQRARRLVSGPFGPGGTACREAA
jgi:hypothetical protein